jgi:hypothetical protein
MQVPYKDLNDKPRNDTVHFNLFEREVFKLMGEFQTVLGYIDRWQKEKETRTIDTPEMLDFYNNFEDIILNAYGTPSDDGQRFDHSGRYEFEDSACFNALMVMCVTDPATTAKLINGIMPSGLEEIVRKADENLIQAAKDASTEDQANEIARLRAQLDAAQNKDETPES